MTWEATVLTFALIDNVVLSRLLGLDSDTAAAGLGPAVAAGGFFTVLMTAAAVAAWALDSQVLLPLGFTLLRTPAFVLLSAGLALGLRAAAARVVPSVLQSAGLSVPRAAINTAVLGLVLITVRAPMDAARSLVTGVAAGAGYFVVSAMMTAIRLRLDVEPVPRSLRGFPLQLITAGLMAWAFLAFDRGFLARFLGL